MKIGQKYVILILFTVLRQNTYGKSRSVGSFPGRPTDRAQNLVFGGSEVGTSVGPVRHAPQVAVAPRLGAVFFF
jgi:hypothetical protein